ncbi:MAG: hypothetical protein Q9223_000290 [Gallowayella weberi]
MPALKPLFSKVLDATGSGSSGSKRNFKKIRSPNADLRGRHSYATSGSSSSRPDTIYKTAESKHSNLSDASQDYQAAETTLPGYSRDSGNIDWAYMAGPEKEDGPEATHIDDASHTSSLPLVRMARQSARELREFFMWSVDAFISDENIKGKSGDGDNQNRGM